MSAQKQHVGRANTRSVARFFDNNWEKGNDFVKICCVKKACEGGGGELERTVDDAFGI